MVRFFDIRFFVDAEAEAEVEDRVSSLNIFLLLLAADATGRCTVRSFDVLFFLDTEAAERRVVRSLEVRAFVDAEPTGWRIVHSSDV